MRVPAIWASSVVCLVVGMGIGVLATTFVKYEGAGRVGWAAPDAPPRPGSEPSMVGMPGGAPGMGGMGGFRGPNPKVQLASLVAKLDLLTGSLPALRLTEDQRKVLREEAQGLDALEELAEDEAKRRLDALLDVLEEHRPTLESVGYRWPGQGGFRPPADSPNPFKEEMNAASLAALQQRLSADTDDAR